MTLDFGPKVSALRIGQAFSPRELFLIWGRAHCSASARRTALRYIELEIARNIMPIWLSR